MTDNDNDSADNESAIPDLEEPAKLDMTPKAKDAPGKAKWGTVAVGVGSAALVAALMYAGRSRRKK